MRIDNNIKISQSNGLNHYRIVLKSFELSDQATQFIDDMKQKHDIDLYISKVQIGPQLEEVATI